MLKLYKFEVDSKKYWETWENPDGSHTVHWGVLGTEGESRVIKKSQQNQKPEEIIQVEIDDVIKQGYAPAEEEFSLLIEYQTEGWGSTQDLEKRYGLEDHLNEILGWTGLGICDGGSIGSGTMSVFCYVVDYELAKKIIVDNLKNTEYRDYTLIHSDEIG